MSKPVMLEDWAIDKYGKPLWPALPWKLHADVIVSIIEGWGKDDDDRRALEMWAWQRATYAEIAEEFGLAGRPSAHYRVQRALDRLRKDLTPDEDE